MTRDERLNELVAIVNGIRFGMVGYDQRLAEMCAGFPAGSGGGGSKGGVGRPVEAQVIATIDEHRRDPAEDVSGDFDKRLSAALREAEALWAEYTRVTHRRMGVTRVSDPGCELCAQVPDNCERCVRSGVADHWCPTYATKEIPVPGRRGQPDTTRKVRLCSSCYEFAREDRANRLPDHAEVIDHAEGRRRRWKLGA